MASARPLVSVYSAEGSSTGKSVALPAVMSAPLRPDVVQFVHTNMNKNARQAYAVSLRAGHQTSAVSWGTGRAVSRIPRVGGGGTQRSGQAAFGNMCRSGRMFGPTKTWRRWHRKINTTQKRFAMTSAIAASGCTPLVMARGHSIDEVVEMPLVVDASSTTTKDAKALLSAVGAYDDVQKSIDSKKIRSGKGKMRNRRYVMRKGPLLVFSAGEESLQKAFRNIPGVDTACVSRLNLLQLAPGGHMGRFVVYTTKAFEELDSLYGASGVSIPVASMTNADLTRIINSDEVQSVVNPAKAANKKYLRKKNAIKSVKALERLSPYAAAARRSETRAQEERKTKKAKKVATKRSNKAGKAFFEKVSTQGEVCSDGF